MGLFSELDIEVREMIATGATRKQVSDSYPMLREDEVDLYFDDDHDGDYFGSYDGQPDEAQEWHDFNPDC